MKKYILNYINSDNEESTREVSEILSKNFGYFDAFDSKYEEISTFRISRIKFLADKNSGEIIDNILEFITLNHGTDEVIREFHWQNRPRTLDEIRRIGKKQFFKKYIFKCIENLYKKKFFESFDNQCYKCKSKSDLIIDHHIPIYLGGKYENGNLVALCRKCNNKKRETNPNEFYDTFEIETLKPILNNQQNIFQFNFNWKAWDENRSKYLESIGFEKQHIENILENPEHNEYIPPKDNSLQVKITLNILKDK